MVDAGVVHVDLRWSIAPLVACTSSMRQIRTRFGLTGFSSPLRVNGPQCAMLNEHSAILAELICFDSWKLVCLVLIGSVCLRASPSAAASGKGSSSMEGFLRMAFGSTRFASIRTTSQMVQTARECHGLSKVLVLCGPTYPARLWCIWELFALMAVPFEESRVTSHPVGACA